MNALDFIAERQQGCDNRAGTGPEDQIEPLVKRAIQQALDLAQDAERVEPFSPAAIQAEDTAEPVLDRLGSEFRRLEGYRLRSGLWAI